MAELIHVGKSVPGQVLVEQAALFARDLVQITPPTRDKRAVASDKDAGISGYEAQKIQGETAIKRDLSKVFTAIDQEFLDTVGSIHGVSNLDFWDTDKNGNPIRHIWQKLDPTGAGMADKHRQARSPRTGRVFYKKLRATPGEWRAGYVVSKEDYAAYEKQVLARVGRQKAPWAWIYKMLGGKSVPRWISRHFSGVRGRLEGLATIKSNKPELVLHNFAAGVGSSENRRRFSEALRIRAEKIQKRIKYLMRPKKT